MLGKIIGVYLGRPFEGWQYEKIMADLGEISYYVHEKRGVPLIVTDDDISGTFTFLRALPDHGNSLDLTPEQIGKTWLNYLIERTNHPVVGRAGQLDRTHRLPAPEARHARAAQRVDRAPTGQVVAEQIGAQIFIDGWAMVAPGDPASPLTSPAAPLGQPRRRSHLRRAVLAAMEAQAFVESDIDTLIDTGVTLHPHRLDIYRLIADLRDWYAKVPDWQTTRHRIDGAVRLR